MITVRLATGTSIPDEYTLSQILAVRPQYTWPVLRDTCQTGLWSCDRLTLVIHLSKTIIHRRCPSNKQTIFYLNTVLPRIKKAKIYAVHIEAGFIYSPLLTQKLVCTIFTIHCDPDYIPYIYIQIFRRKQGSHML